MRSTGFGFQNNLGTNQKYHALIYFLIEIRSSPTTWLMSCLEHWFWSWFAWSIFYLLEFSKRGWSSYGSFTISNISKCFNRVTLSSPKHLQSIFSPQCPAAFILGYFLYTLKTSPNVIENTLRSDWFTNMKLIIPRQYKTYALIFRLAWPQITRRVRGE